MGHYAISNGKLSATISSLGGEWVSFKSGDEEYLWSGDPAIWAGRAPYLFPIVGKLKDDLFYFEEKEYRMPKHGFARKMEFDLVEKRSDSLVLRLGSSPETSAVYPFEFELKVEYRLTGKSFVNKVTIKNADLKEMVFGFGFHPGFRLPGFPGSQPWTLEFEKSEKADAYKLENSLLTEKPDPTGSLEKIFLITSDKFNNDAWIYKEIKSRKIGLKDSFGKARLQFSWTGCSSLGIWAKPEAPYVCIEPWVGYNDTPSADKELQKKKQFTTLRPGGEIELGFEVEPG